MVAQKEKKNILKNCLLKYPIGTGKKAIQINEKCYTEKEMLICEIKEKRKHGSRHYIDEDGNHRSGNLYITLNICYIFNKKNKLIKIDVLEINRSENNIAK